MDVNPPWPDVNVSQWAGTKRSLHLYSQMLGKIKVALAPVQPNWMFTALYLTPRGITTGTLPWQGSSFEVSIDLYDSAMVLARSNGARVTIPLLPVRSVAAIFAGLRGALAEQGIACPLNPIPQEVPDTTPLDTDDRPSEYDPAAALRWFEASTIVTGIFDAWRTCFFGRTGIQLWWGAFDISMMLFSGRRVAPPTDRGYLLKYDLDAELMNVGLYFGDEKTPPFFYGYIYPEPKGANSLPVAPSQASWSEALHEWVLPYEAVRSAADPAATLRAFTDAIYELCFTAAGWSRDACSYDKPPIACRKVR